MLEQMVSRQMTLQVMEVLTTPSMPFSETATTSETSPRSERGLGVFEAYIIGLGLPSDF